jgi:hypothetical protein
MYVTIVQELATRGFVVFSVFHSDGKIHCFVSLSFICFLTFFPFRLTMQGLLT